MTAIQKPGKTKGPVTNLRLLSMLRNFLASCMKQKIIDRLDREVPSQAAYRAGRSTTEYVFATKILAEKVITSKECTIFLNGSRRPIEDNKYELHVISISMLQVELSVRCGNSCSEFFKQIPLVPQGDGPSANQFTFYLNTLKNTKHNEHDYPIPKTVNPATQVMSEHCYTKPINDEVNIDQEYADVINNNQS